MEGTAIERVRALFEQARKLPRSQWNEWADAHCDDPGERARLLELLAGDTTMGGGIELEPLQDEAAPAAKGAPPRPAGAPPTPAAAAPTPAGAQDAAAFRAASDPMMGKEIGGAKIIGFVGEGGMGRVYLGELPQPDGKVRRVAVKLLSRGFGKPEAVARFQREASILGKLSHPGVAEIISSGLYDDGSGGMPFMVLEFVEEARQLADFANERKLDTRGRLELFLRVCEAVGYAHSMQILHRDLKPANLLVDRFGRIKVIDFGVARAAGADLGIASVRTETGQLMGTLQYMSPEQIAADPRAIDVRTDVYALGVILYEILCDTYPYDLRGMPVHEAARAIAEAKVPSPRTIDPTVDEAMESIVMKCLEKNREKRFDSGASLAAALSRYLSGPASSRSAPRAPIGLEDAPGAAPARARAPGAAPRPPAGTAGPPRLAPQRVKKSSAAGWVAIVFILLLAIGGGLIAMGVIPLKKLLAGAPPTPSVAPPPVAEGSGNIESIRVVTSPEGAAVSVDGHAEGHAPVSLMLSWHADSKTRQVEISMPGYEPVSEVVVADPAGKRAEPLRLVFNLTPLNEASLKSLKRLLVFRVEGGPIELKAQSGAAQRYISGQHEVPVELARDAAGAWGPVQVTVIAPGKHIEAFGASGDGEVTATVPASEIRDRPAPIRVSGPPAAR